MKSEGASASLKDNPKAISIREQANFRNYAEARIKKMFEHAEVLYKNICIEFGSGTKGAIISFPHIEFRPTYARSETGVINEAVMARYHKFGKESESIRPKSIIVYLPAYERFLEMASKTDAARKHMEKFLDIHMGHELGHEVLDAIFYDVLPKYKGCFHSILIMEHLPVKD
jgi:hypothetical protein